MEAFHGMVTGMSVLYAKRRESHQIVSIIEFEEDGKIRELLSSLKYEIPGQIFFNNWQNSALMYNEMF